MTGRFRLSLLFVLLAAAPAGAEVRTSGIWGLSPCATVGGHEIDRLFFLILAVTGGVLVAVQAVWLYFLVKYRRREGVAAHYTLGNNRLELLWTAIPFLVFLGLFVVGDSLWLRLRTPPPEGTALDVEIVGEQYDWLIRYPGPDGILGRADDARITPLNKIGLDPADPHGRDDVRLYNEMVVPIGRPVHLHLRSRDVIHAFYVPEFRLYQDLVPGRTIGWVSFTADRLGTYSIACNQLCGSGHDAMQGTLRVVSVADYEKWMAEKVAASRTAAGGPDFP